ncbi:MAG: hypothetical protein Q7S27_05555 [Nanoarchaeota archaeon]|nr:hypothetical protein [Nanoarchaeota archaeon]
MLYKQYKVKIGKKESILGILGENHFPLPLERDFARPIVQEYNYIALEGTDKGNLVDIATGLCSIPYIIYTLYKNDWNTTTVKHLANEEGKPLIRFEDPHPPYKMALIGLGLLACTPVLPFRIARDFLKGELKRKSRPYKTPEEASKFAVKVASNRFNKYFGEIEKRDKFMSKKIYSLIKEGISPLLVNVGLSHVPGITRNLESLFDESYLVSEETPPYSSPFMPESR